MEAVREPRDDEETGLDTDLRRYGYMITLMDSGLLPLESLGRTPRGPEWLSKETGDFVDIFDLFEI